MLLLLQWFEKDTVGEYRRRYGDDELVRVVEIAHPSTGEIFVKRLYKELDAVIDEIERTAALRQKDGEDHITSDIVLGLRRAGYNATHDAYSKGHADIKVAQDEFVWLGEAKIHDGYDYLLKGLKQLLSRYATGREKGSGLLVYIKGGNASAVLDEWRHRLEKGKECNLKGTEDADKAEKLVFWSIHTHKGSGLEIRTKHLGVSLYFRPEA
jgi:hypothetical protein